jgi:hypothetical protein
MIKEGLVGNRGTRRLLGEDLGLRDREGRAEAAGTDSTTTSGPLSGTRKYHPFALIMAFRDCQAGYCAGACNASTEVLFELFSY